MALYAAQDIVLLVSRASSENSPDNKARILDSIQTAFSIGDGVFVCGYGERSVFSTRFEADGITFMEPNEYLFSFNNPLAPARNAAATGWLPE
jgi:excinuclease ABC subunit A